MDIFEPASLIIARMYGNRISSWWVGHCARRITRSNSSCALACTFGRDGMMARNHIIVPEVCMTWSATAYLREKCDWPNASLLWQMRWLVSTYRPSSLSHSPGIPKLIWLDNLEHSRRTPCAPSPEELKHHILPRNLGAVCVHEIAYESESIAEAW